MSRASERDWRANGQIATREEGEKRLTSPRARRFSLMIANFAEENERLLVL